MRSVWAMTYRELADEAEKNRQRIAELEAERDALLEACELALQGYIDILQADLLPDHKAETQMVVNTLDAAIRKAKGEGA